MDDPMRVWCREDSSSISNATMFRRWKNKVRGRWGQHEFNGSKIGPHTTLIKCPFVDGITNFGPKTIHKCEAKFEDEQNWRFVHLFFFLHIVRPTIWKGGVKGKNNY